MQPEGEDPHWTALPIVGRVVNELIVASDLGEAESREAVIGLDNRFGTSLGELTVADDPAQPSRRQIRLAVVRDLVGNGG
jgi:hypothetical protein